jgi:hypothetical protein
MNRDVVERPDRHWGGRGERLSPAGGATLTIFALIASLGACGADPGHRSIDPVPSGVRAQPSEVRDHDPAPARVAIAVADPVARPSLPAAGPVATLLDPLPGVDASANAALAIAIDPDPRVRRVAIASLEPAGAIDPLTLALDDPQPEVRERALIALARLRTPAALGLIDQARSDDDPDVRALAEDLGRGLALSS